MTRILIPILLLIFLNITPSAAQEMKSFPPTIYTSAYNPLAYTLYCDYQPLGFFASYTSVFQAAQKEIDRKAKRFFQIYQGNNLLFFHKQYSRHRNAFIPWQLEISKGCQAMYFQVSWEGEAEIALVSPGGKIIRQKDFGLKYPNILSYSNHSGTDVLILNPESGIWKVWVLGKFKNEQIHIPKFYKAFTADYQLKAKGQSLYFAVHWENNFFQDTPPIQFFLADAKGRLFGMQSYNPNILTELTGYNGKTMEINAPLKGSWKAIALSTEPELVTVQFSIFSRLQIVEGTIRKFIYDKSSNSYLVYWLGNNKNNFPKVLFISALSADTQKLTNLIVPLKNNPQVIPADYLPKTFSYKYYITSPFGKAEDGLLKGPLPR